MKPGVSSLNPYAAAYIPLSKREADDRTFAPSKDSSRNNDAVWFGAPQNMTQNQNHTKAYLGPDSPGSIAKAFALNNYPTHGSYGSSSQNVNEVTENEEFDMDLEYLQMAFPGISDQSLADVYSVNKRDLEASIDMLNQLEVYTVESSETLPDTLDIGDVSESGMSPKSAWKMKNVASEASGSPKA